MTDAPQWKQVTKEDKSPVVVFRANGLSVEEHAYFNQYIKIPLSLLSQVQNEAYNRGYKEGFEHQLKMRMLDARGKK